jgi:hypothetical protein
MDYHPDVRVNPPVALAGEHAGFFGEKPRGNCPAQLLKDAHSKDGKLNIRRISRGLNATAASVLIVHPNKAAVGCQALVHFFSENPGILERWNNEYVFHFSDHLRRTRGKGPSDIHHWHIFSLF